MKIFLFVIAICCVSLTYFKTQSNNADEASQLSILKGKASSGSTTQSVSWDPDAGVIPSLTKSAKVIASSNSQTMNKVLDGNAQTHWISDAPYPNGYIQRADLNILLNRKNTNTAITNAKNATDGNEFTEAIVSKKGNKAWIEFQFEKATPLYTVAAKMSKLSKPIEVVAILQNGKKEIIGNFLPTDYDVLIRLKTQLNNVKTLRLQSTEEFNIREVAALATPAKEFVTIDLLQPKIIGWIETRHWAGEGTATATELLLSADNKKWYKVADLDPNSLHAISTKIEPAVKARYIKVVHTLVEKDWNKVFLWKINAYDQNGPFGAMPTAKKNPNSFNDLLGVNAIWGWGHKSYSQLLKKGEGPELYNSIAKHARNYHFINWEVTDPDHTPDYKAMAEGKGLEAQAWLDWDREYKVWKAKDLRVHAAVKFGEIDANKWDTPYESAYKYGYAFAQHFGPTNGNGLVDVMEIGNEPWYYEADLYKNILLGMAKGAKDADPKMFVLPCALHAAYPQNETEGLFKNYMGARITEEIAPYLDGINVHYYSWTHQADGTRIAVHPEHPASDMRGLLNDIRFRNKNMPGKPIYVTEWGWDSDGGGEDCTHSECVSEQAQAIYAIRGLLMYARLGVDGMTWFFYANEGPTSSLFTRSGLTSSPSKAFKKKKSYYALQNFIKTLGDKHFLKVIKEDGQAWVYLLGDKNGKATHLVAWKAVSEKDKKNYKISFPFTKETKSIMSLDGSSILKQKAISIKPKAAQLTIDISAIPVVLEIK